MADVALLDLPPDCAGVPYSLRAQALATAEIMLTAPVIAALGAAVAEQAIVSAAAHWLVTSGHVRPSQPWTGKATGRWAGSSHGDVVINILAQLPRDSARVRGLPFAV
jgi:hypothetical protein